ncbi:MAG TPA: hypothetical protein VM537_27095 [Anaerolineae bacterium]|nr:hypothetical protein [Anaerolineae bacterium]
MSEKQRAGMDAALLRWLNTRQLAEICNRASGNAAERECRHAAERLGFRWLKFGVDHEEGEDRADRFADHMLYAMVSPGQRPLPHRAMSEATWTRLCREAGCVGRGRLERTERVLAEMGQGRLPL